MMRIASPPSPRAKCLAALIAICAGACSDSSEDGSFSGDDVLLTSGAVSCTTDPRLDTYTANLEKAGELGVLSFRFSDLAPAPPAKGSDTFHLQLTDAGQSVAMGELGVNLNMPDHGHGTSVKPVVSFDAATRQYTVTPLYLFMAGVWRIEFDAYSVNAQAAPPVDRVVLHFCVEG